MANEVAEKAKRCKKECMILKVDYEKAYDLLWSFLYEMREILGFCAR